MVRAETLFRASFSIMLWRWVTTVARLMLRREAISLLMRPFGYLLVDEAFHDECYYLYFVRRQLCSGLLLRGRRYVALIGMCSLFE